MAAIRSKNTKPEVLVRNYLWRRGFRYRLNNPRLPGHPDIVLRKYRTCIFVNGCFWHGHKGCKNYSVPKTNTEFWTAKVARNQERDQEVWRQLEARGGSVIIVWECELKKSVLNDTVARVAEDIRQNGLAWRQEREERRKVRASYRQAQKEREARERKLLASVQVQSVLKKKET